MTPSLHHAEKIPGENRHIGAICLGVLSVGSLGYGLQELMAALHIEQSEEWIERALPGAAGLMLGSILGKFIMQAVMG